MCAVCFIFDSFFVTIFYANSRPPKMKAKKLVHKSNRALKMRRLHWVVFAVPLDCDTVRRMYVCKFCRINHHTAGWFNVGFGTTVCRDECLCHRVSLV